MRLKLGDVIMIILGCLAVLLVIATVFMMNEHERVVNMPCEDIIRQNTDTNYVPIPKRCQ